MSNMRDGPLTAEDWDSLDEHPMMPAPAAWDELAALRRDAARYRVLRKEIGTNPDLLAALLHKTGCEDIDTLADGLRALDAAEVPGE